jgi:hypothetical protein
MSIVNGPCPSCAEQTLVIESKAAAVAVATIGFSM